MFRSRRRYPLAALVFVLLMWVPVGTAQAEVVAVRVEQAVHNPCGATVLLSRPVPLLDVRLEYASSLLAHELGEAFFRATATDWLTTAMAGRPAARL
jgi:hypothetical protein